MSQEENRRDTDQLEKIDLIRLWYKMKKGLRRLWLPLLIVTACCGAAMYVRARLIYKPDYRAYSTFTVTSSSAYGYSSDNYNNTVAANLGEAFPYILKSHVLQEIVAKDLGVSSIPGTIHTSVMKDTNLITLSVDASDGEMAYRILQSYIKNYPKISQSVIGTVKLDLMDQSGVPRMPENAKNYRHDVEIGIVYGLVISFFILLIYALVRRTVTTEDDLKEIFHAAVLGSVPEVEFKKRGRHNKLGDTRVIFSNEEVSYAFREAVRRMRTRFGRVAREDDLKTVLVTSSIIGEGKSTIASNLALSLAREGRTVLLIDGDLRNPSVGFTLGLAEQEIKDAQDAGRMGFCDLLTGAAEPQQVIVRTENDHLHILPGGKPVDNAVGLLSAEHAGQILDELRDSYDSIVIDSPPSALLPDSSILADYTDGIIYVVRQDYCRIDRILTGVGMFSDKNVSIEGCVLNGVDQSEVGYSYGYSYGGHGYGNYGSYYGYGEKDGR